MRVIGSHAFLRPVLVLVAVTLTACSAPTPTVPTASIAPLPTVVKITIAGLPTSVTYQQSVQLAAMATLADGAQKQTLDSEWQSSDPTVATVSPTGLLTLVGFGDADVTATFENLRASAHVAASRPMVRYDISGVVHESAPTEHVLPPGATVGIHFVGCPSCPHDNQTTTTDGSGRFTLPGIDVPGFVLVVVKPGYEAKSYAVAQLPRDQHPDIGLTPELAIVSEHHDFIFQRSDMRQDGVSYRDISFGVHHRGAIAVQECDSAYIIDCCWLVRLFRRGDYLAENHVMPVIDGTGRSSRDSSTRLGRSATSLGDFTSCSPTQIDNRGANPAGTPPPLRRSTDGPGELERVRSSFTWDG